jgi:glycosyltransferase involved in cell wall biosynthesis
VIDSRVFLVSRRWQHHATHSGYDLLGNYVGKTITSRPLPKWLLPNKLLWRMAKGFIPYDREAVALELKTFWHMATHKNCLYHFLYGEASFKFLGNLCGWRGHKIVVTYHVPPNRFSEIITGEKPLRKLSAVIILGKNQIETFIKIVPEKKIHFVPHGIDTTFFYPISGNVRLENQVLFVGNHLRDFNTLRQVIELAFIRLPDIHFVIVTLKENFTHFENMKGNIKLLNDISDEDLRDYYRTSKILVMPLIDTVANNSLIEAMACGLPAIVTDVGATRDYVDESCACLVGKGDFISIIDKMQLLINNPDYFDELSSRSRKRSEIYSWSIISDQMKSIYKDILGLRE